MCPQTLIFRTGAPTLSRLQSFIFLSVKTFKNPHTIRLQFKMKSRFTIALFMSVCPFATFTGPLIKYDGPLSYVYILTLIQVEDILNMYCEVRLD